MKVWEFISQKYTLKKINSMTRSQLIADLEGKTKAVEQQIKNYQTGQKTLEPTMKQKKLKTQLTWHKRSKGLIANKEYTWSVFEDAKSKIVNVNRKGKPYVRMYQPWSKGKEDYGLEYVKTEKNRLLVLKGKERNAYLGRIQSHLYTRYGVLHTKESILKKARRI